MRTFARYYGITVMREEMQVRVGPEEGPVVPVAVLKGVGEIAWGHLSGQELVLTVSYGVPVPSHILGAAVKTALGGISKVTTEQIGREPLSVA